MSCTNPDSIRVVIGADDVIRIGLYQYGEEPWPPVWWSNVTRVVATIGSATLDSAVDSSLVSWDAQALDLKLGKATGLVEGWEELRLRVYQQDYPDGLAVWSGAPTIEAIV